MLQCQKMGNREEAKRTAPKPYKMASNRWQEPRLDFWCGWTLSWVDFYKDLKISEVILQVAKQHSVLKMLSLQGWLFAAWDVFFPNQVCPCTRVNFYGQGWLNATTQYSTDIFPKHELLTKSKKLALYLYLFVTLHLFMFVTVPEPKSATSYNSVLRFGTHFTEWSVGGFMCMCAGHCIYLKKFLAHRCDYHRFQSVFPPHMVLAILSWCAGLKPTSAKFRWSILPFNIRRKLSSGFVALIDYSQLQSRRITFKLRERTISPEDDWSASDC